MMYKNGEKPIANPFVVLREEFDDWAVLFNPDTGRGFGLSPTGVYLWKLLDGEHSVDDLLMALRRDAENVPQEVGDHLFAFVAELAQQGLAVYDAEQMDHDGGCLPSRPTYAGTMAFNYEPPKLINLSGEQAAGACCYSGTTPGLSTCCPGDCVLDPDCRDGGCANRYCGVGSSAGSKCMTGASASDQCDCGNSVSYVGYTCGGGNCDALKCGGGSAGPPP